MYTTTRSTSIAAAFDGQKIPSTVFKFRDWSNSHHREILAGKLYFASPLDFNDPFDCNIPIAYEVLQGNTQLQQEYFWQIVARESNNVKIFSKLLVTDAEKQAEVDRLIKEGRFNKSYWIESSAKASRERLGLIGVFCLSLGKADILQWAHYANSHQGFCIGFHSKLLFSELLENYRVGGGSVSYYDEYPVLLPTASDNDKIFIPLMSKAKLWCYEKEYRLFKLMLARKTLSVSKGTIKEIVLGCNMKSLDKEIILAYIEKELPHIKIFQSQLARTAFRLSFKRLK